MNQKKSLVNNILFQVFLREQKFFRFSRRIWKTSASVEELRWNLEAKLRRLEFYEQAWRQAAELHGAKVKPLVEGFMGLSLGEQTCLVQCNGTPLDSLAASNLVVNKTIVRKLFTDAGIPVPPGVSFSSRSLTSALDFLAETGGPVVVKPDSNTGGGDGIQTNVRTRLQLLRAAASALMCGPGILVEKQVEGDTYRLLFLDGQIIDAVRRRPPKIVGDGQHTIRQLVVLANEERITRDDKFSFSQTSLSIDGEMIATLKSHGLHLDYIPRQGEVITVKTVINQNSAEENEAAMSLLHPSVVETATKAAKLLMHRYIGIDIITKDPGIPLSQSDGFVIEANTTPGFHYHYNRKGGSFPIAEYVLQTIFGKRGYPTVDERNPVVMKDNLS